MDLTLQPKQGIAFRTRATEDLYGGAAGGGKSYLLRASAIRWCVEIPGIQVYLFRRTLPDLRDNHLRGPTSLHAMLAPFMDHGRVRYRAVENEFEFWNGSILHLCYCDSENDVEKYRGAEIHVLIIDELTHFSEYQYRFLRSRVRVAGLNVPDKYAPFLPRIETASNPGSIGHAWVKRTFIAPRPPLEIWRVPAEEGGMLRQFIPARLADNPYLTKDDPEYANRLRGLGADSLVRAMLDGDWDIVAGQAFEKLARKTHCIEPFTPPEDWLCFGSFDWGSSKPFSFGMWAVANGNALPDGRRYNRGAMIRWNEWYGWNGKPNEGLRMEAEAVARGIRAKIADCGRKLSYIAADPSIWKVDGGPSIAETFLRNGVTLRKADNSRLVGYIQLRGRIAGDEEGPMLLATSNCHAGFWRTMPDIVMDENKPEDIDTHQEDHCADDCRYGAMSRPWMRVVKVDKPKVRDWNFEREEIGDAEQSWKTV
ncbi:MAG: terminase large subunit domain-containing protein [Burkholderiales bacterium]